MADSAQGRGFDLASHLETLLMSGAGSFQKLIAWQRLLPPLQPLLQTCFWIFLKLAWLKRRQQRGIELVDNSLGNQKSGIKIDGTEQRFKGIGQDGRTKRPAAFQFPLTKTQGAANTQAKRQLVQGFLIDQVGAQPGKIPLGEVGKAVVQGGSYRTIKNPVAEEFKAFVIRRAETAMGQRGPQQ